MILTKEHIKKEIELIKGYNLVLYKHYREFEVKIIDNFTGESLIIDNDFMSKRALKLEAYRVLCFEIVNELVQGLNLSQLSIQ